MSEGRATTRPWRNSWASLLLFSCVSFIAFLREISADEIFPNCCHFDSSTVLCNTCMVEKIPFCLNKRCVERTVERTIVQCVFVYFRSFLRGMYMIHVLINTTRKLFTDPYCTCTCTSVCNPQPHAQPSLSYHFTYGQTCYVCTCTVCTLAPMLLLTAFLNNILITLCIVCNRISKD